jgi:hypothetical protein
MFQLKGAFMATCHQCGAQTEYYQLDLPTCLMCSASLKKEPEPKTTPVPNDVQLGLPHE